MPSCSASSSGVGEVAVVPEREAGVADRAVDRLRVAPAARPGGRVAHVADGEVALERGEAALVEHLRDQPHVLRHGDGLAVAHRDAGRLLAPVLEGVEAEVGEVGDGLTGRVHAEHAAGVADLGRRSRTSVSHAPRVVNPDRGPHLPNVRRFRTCVGLGAPNEAVNWRIVRCRGRSGRASRQAVVASARVTAKAPSATRRSPPAVPRRWAGTLAARARSTRSSASAGSTATTTRDADSENHASDGTSSEPSATVEPALRRRSPSRPARPRARRRSTSWTPATARAATSVAHEVVQRAPRRRGRRPVACRRADRAAPAHSEPPSSGAV